MKKRLSKKANWFKKNSFTDEDELYVGVEGQFECESVGVGYSDCIF